jgi:hypothetical protein
VSTCRNRRTPWPKADPARPARRTTWDDSAVSYDLAVWDGEPPLDDTQAGALCDELYARYLESDDVLAPVEPRVAAYVEALLERYPEDPDGVPAGAVDRRTAARVRGGHHGRPLGQAPGGLGHCGSRRRARSGRTWRQRMPTSEAHGTLAAPRSATALDRPVGQTTAGMASPSLCSGRYTADRCAPGTADTP